ncbi:hypothetical protein ACFL3C_02300 [Patescibacteria group bacterium]
MNYKDLKELVKYLKEVTKCPHCKKRFVERDVSILATLPAEAVFQLDCHSCHNTILVNIGMDNQDKIGSSISDEDINSMRDFLSEFNGDFKQLFKPSKSK